MPANRSIIWHPPATVHPSELHAPLPPEYICVDPIPPPTALTPGELLDKFYSDIRSLPNWKDLDALLQIQLSTHLVHPNIASGPLGSSGLVGHWPRPNGLAAVPVPVNDVVLGKKPAVIEFKNLDRKYPSSGVPLKDFYTMNARRLKDAEDPFPNAFGTRVLNFVVAWPGYKAERFPIPVVPRNGKSLTRFDLGRIVAMAYARVFMAVEEGKVLPDDVGFYNIALHQGHNAKPDSLGVQLLQLHLIRLRGTVGGDWVADIEIV